jgi:Tol biopolymer transport system component
MLGVSGWSLHAQWTHRYPPVKGIANAVYLEGFELPTMGAGPTDPAASPDGKTIAIAARGWLWILDPATGEAKRLTKGADMDSRPAWSPDGKRVAFLRDDTRDIDIIEVEVASGAEKTLVATPALDLDPAYAADGRTLFYSSAEAGDFDIWRLDLHSGQRTRVTDDPGLELRPLPVPRRNELVYVAKVNPRDSVVVLNLSNGSRRVLKEDGLMTQTRPAIKPDGHALAVPLPGTDGVWDLWLMDIAGGPLIHLTRGNGLPLTPAWSPDGAIVYFVEADADQCFHLYSVHAAGGHVTDVSPATWNWGEPTSRVQVTTRIGNDPKPTPARVTITDRSGHPALPEHGQARFDPQNGVVYVYSPGTLTVEVPAGEIKATAAYGFSAIPAIGSVPAPAGRAASLDLRLESLWRPESEGWYSGDHHHHLNYGGQFNLAAEDLIPILKGEDLDVATPLLANLQTRFNDRQFWTWQRLSEGPPLIAFGQEIRPHFFGHMGIIGVQSLHWPWYWGPGYEVVGRDDRPNLSTLAHARREGGVAYFVHPVRGGDPFPTDGPPRNIPLALVPEAVHGDLDALEIACIWSDEQQTADVWYRFLNLGIPVAPSAGTDAFPNYYRGQAIGVTRVYVRPDGPLNLSSYLDALKKGRSFVTNGPLVKFTVENTQPGGTIQTTGGQELKWQLTAVSAIPYDKVDLIVNGTVAWTGEGLREAGAKSYTGTVTAPSGGWIAMRVLGSPAQLRWPAQDTYPFAHTAPIWVNHVGSTEPEAVSRASRDLLNWMDVADKRLIDGYGDAEIPIVKKRFADTRRKLEEWAQRKR